MLLHPFLLGIKKYEILKILLLAYWLHFLFVPLFLFLNIFFFLLEILENWPYFVTMCQHWLHFGDNKFGFWESTEWKQDLTLTNTESHSVFMEECLWVLLECWWCLVCICSSSWGIQGGEVIPFHLWHDSHSTWVLSKGQNALLIHHHENLIWQDWEVKWKKAIDAS